MYSSPDPAVKECDYIFSAKDKNAVLKVISLIQTTFKSQLTLSDTYFEPQSQMEKVFKLANINRHLLFNTDLDATGVSLSPFNSLHSATYFSTYFTWIQRA